LEANAARDGKAGHPQLRAVFPGQEPIERSSMNSWDDKNFVAAIEKSGRKKILIADCRLLPTQSKAISES
jgi:hypothetical protein